MSVEVLMNVTPTESRVVLVENGILQEVHIERQVKRGLVGNIYMGKISRVLPGMQAAFVDIGLDKAAFLHASDIVTSIDGDTIERHERPEPNITSLVHQGQHIMVQVVKDPLGTKGARLTTDITLPSRYLVFMPQSSHVGVSQRIDDSEERERLKQLAESLSTEDGYFIVRTAAEGTEEGALKGDAEFLTRLWQQIKKRKKSQRKVGVLYEDLNLCCRVLRDFVGEEIERIRVDSRTTLEQLKTFTDDFIPELGPVLEYYTGDRPIFDLFDIENEIQRALDRRVDLKSGGSLIIDQTEAMTTIDINTGAFVGHRNLEETIFNTNIEATQAIARQLRLRNLGGIIIIDFIDMQNDEHKRRVLHSLEQALAKDRAKTSINGFTTLGLVEMTRKRTRESLEHVLCGECPVCRGRGSMKTVETVCYEIMREIVRVHKAYEADKFVVYASAAVREALLNEESHALAELELFVSRQITIQTETLYNQEQFDVVMM
ncbi:MAG: ribonuclease E/G [Idiomarina sp.]|uniref:ribonuclease G n=1 Tax=Idiomarina sp. TaxID=1874361 RepID=UPI000C115A65|nr:ribonuclease G [Idiomarina sp.]MBL4742364.1 ribonuclease G [Idiomarina sp.]PHQ77012.1 MAG: ribonuclease E/G [Idiomarina sp.]